MLRESYLLFCDVVSFVLMSTFVHGFNNPHATIKSYTVMFYSVLFADIVLYNVSSYRITLSVRPWKRGMVWCGLALPRLRIYEGDILRQSLQAPLIRRFYSVLLCYVRFVLLFRVLFCSVLYLSWFLMESGMFCRVL